MAGTTFIQAIKGATPTVAGVTKLSDTSGIAMSVDDVTAAIPNKNYIINGNFDIWQRGTSQTTDGYGSDDRWYNSNSVSTKVHTQEEFAVGQTDVPNNPKYYSRTVVTNVDNGGSIVLKEHKIEGVRTLSGGLATISFWAKADTNKNIAVSLRQYFGSGGSSDVSYIGVQLVALTANWEKHEITVSVPSISGKTLGTANSIKLQFYLNNGVSYEVLPVGVGQQSGTFDIAQVKLEKGSVATEFEPKTFAEELRDCQRYYEKSYSQGINPGAITNIGAMYEPSTRNTSSVTPGFRFSVAKRTIPTIELFSSAGGTKGKISNPTDKTAAPNSVSTCSVFNIAITSGTTTTSAIYHWTADAEL